MPRYAALEGSLRQLLALATEVPQSIRQAVSHYLDHNEFGLALDTLGDLAIEQDVALTSSTIDAMSAFYAPMRAEPRNIDALRQRRHT